MSFAPANTSSKAIPRTKARERGDGRTGTAPQVWFAIAVTGRRAENGCESLSSDGSQCKVQAGVEDAVARTEARQLKVFLLKVAVASLQRL